MDHMISSMVKSYFRRENERQREHPRIMEQPIGVEPTPEPWQVSRGNGESTTSNPGAPTDFMFFVSHHVETPTFLLKLL